MTIFNSYVKLPEGNRIMMYLLTPSWTTSMLWPLGWEESLTTGDCIHKHLQTVMFVVYDGHFNRENEFLNHWNWAKRTTSWCFLRWWYPHLEEPKIAEAHPFRAWRLHQDYPRLYTRGHPRAATKMSPQWQTPFASQASSQTTIN